MDKQKPIIYKMNNGNSEWNTLTINRIINADLIQFNLKRILFSIQCLFTIFIPRKYNPGDRQLQSEFIACIIYKCSSKPTLLFHDSIKCQLNAH